MFCLLLRAVLVLLRAVLVLLRPCCVLLHTFETPENPAFPHSLGLGRRVVAAICAEKVPKNYSQKFEGKFSDLIIVKNVKF